MFLKCLSENDGLPVYHMLQEIARDDNGFHNEAKDMPYEEFPKWLARNAGYAEGRNMPDWMVPETHYWLIDGDTPVGYGRLRHCLNDALRNEGGHIGYAVARPYRGRGCGNEILRLLLLKAREMGIKEVQVGANKDNVRSNKVILANGGRLSKETETKNLYAISLIG